MINLSGPSLTFPNVTRWEVFDFNVNSGKVTYRFWSPPNTQPQPLYIELEGKLSDQAGRSSGPAPNPGAITWNDKVIMKSPIGPSSIGGVGAANSLSNARNAYQTANPQNHTAGLKAVELRLLTDQVVDSFFAGT